VASIFRPEGYIKQESSFASCLLHAGFLLGLLFRPEDQDNILLQNAGQLSMDYMAL
jgi:hypothetical protein